MDPHETDAALVALARDGDRRAGQLLLTRHYPMLVRLCRRALHDAILAEDAAQEAAVQALLSLDRLQHPEKFGPWLAGIGLNICRRWLQRRSREDWSIDQPIGERSRIDLADDGIGTEALIEIDEFQTRVHDAVTELPPGQRAAVSLVYLDGLSHREAATVLDVPTSAIKTRLFKARRTLRQRLHDTWMEEYMTTTTDTRWIEFRVRDVRRGPATGANDTRRHSMILEEVGGKQRQAIWGIPASAAEEIAIQLAGVAMPRPISCALTYQVVSALGGSLREIRIPRVESGVGVAEVVIDVPTGEHILACRVSDAVSLALLSTVPIRYDAAWLTADENADDAARRQQINDQLHGSGTAGSAEIAAEVVEQFNRATAP